MKDTIDRLRNHFEHEVTRANRHADLDETMQGSQKKGDRFGWIIGAAAVVAIFVVGAVALSQRTSFDTPATEDSDVVSSPTTVDSATTESPEWVEEGITEFVPSPAHDVWESEGMLYAISTKAAPNNPEVWTNSAFSSDDGGLTWTEIDHPSDSVGQLAVADGVLYTVSTGSNRNELTAATSRDGGATWDMVDLPVGSEIDTVRSAGLVSSPEGGVTTATQETTNVVRRAIPSEYQSDEYMVLWGEEASSEEVAVPATTMVTEESVTSQEESVPPAETEPPATDGLTDEDLDLMEESGDDARGVDTMPKEPEPEEVIVFGSNREVVYEASFEDLGISEPVTTNSRTFHIDDTGEVTERTDDPVFGSEGEVYSDRLYDLGDTMLLTGWSGDAYLAAVSTDGTNWTPVDLHGTTWVVAAGPIGDQAMIVGAGPDGLTLFKSDDPMTSWTQVESPIDDPMVGIKAHVGDRGAVIATIEDQEGDSLEEVLAGGTIFTSTDGETWTSQELADLGVDTLDTFGTPYVGADRAYITGVDVEGSEVAERRLFSMQLD